MKTCQEIIRKHMSHCIFDDNSDGQFMLDNVPVLILENAMREYSDQFKLSPENKQELGELLANLRDSITNEINKHQSHVVIKVANDLRLTRPYKNTLIGISFMEDIKFMTIDNRCLLADKLQTLTT